MNKEEAELFNIANNFGIRHHNQKQKTEYDKGIWHAWIFYCYLATIHACLRLLNKEKQEVKVNSGKKTLLQSLRDKHIKSINEE